MHEANVDEEHAKLDAIDAEEAEEGAEVQKVERERPPFDVDEFKEQFDEANAPIQIPPEVTDDIDNDFDLPWSPPVFEKEWEWSEGEQERKVYKVANQQLKIEI